MENTNGKFITISLLVTGILVGITVNVFIETLTGVMTGEWHRMLAKDWVHHGLPVLAGVVFFAATQFNPRVLSWATDVVSELRKIVWPSAKDTRAMTIVVCIMLLISGAFLGLLDVVSGSLIDWLVHV